MTVTALLWRHLRARRSTRVSLPSTRKRAMPKNYRILVVEDDRAVRDLLRLHLENAGYHVVALPDAVAAGKHVLGDPASIHLLIVDANLPYMSGIEFASALIADTALPFIPMILITGHEHLADR